MKVFKLLRKCSREVARISFFIVLIIAMGCLFLLLSFGMMEWSYKKGVKSGIDSKQMTNDAFLRNKNPPNQWHFVQ